MGTSRPNAEGVLPAEQPPPVPSEPPVSPSRTPGQDVAQQQAPASSTPTDAEGEEAGRARDGGTCIPRRGGARREGRPVSPGSPEAESCCSWPAGCGDRPPGEPRAAPGGSPAPGPPEPPWHPSAPTEETGHIVLALEEGGPRAAPGPEAPAGEEDEEGTEQGALLPGSPEPGAAEPSCCIQAEDGGERECPICTELYDSGPRRPALLNCGHALCGQCLHAIMAAGSAADIGRMRCPMCRQKTPMMEWEIARLQEELLLLSSAPGPALAPPTPHLLPARRPGFWGGLEHHFQVRFHTGRAVGFLPCLRYPRCLVGGLARLREGCRPGYLLVLLVLLGAEMLSLLVFFLPLALLLLVFLFLDR
ncbi:translation initiation factor IF-2-like [Varanus komodoensis]|uniref:translation initiation factor IF-2-like n=1 Tax=Varanus komodoensis TaxID=61221 RepID=UPI001CF7CD85|nr:translation initiation factor IF-2-like [Varanus komodoensis]